MKCESLFFGKNKKNISECRLLKVLPSMLRVKAMGIEFLMILQYFLICLK